MLCKRFLLIYGLVVLTIFSGVSAAQNPVVYSDIVTLDRIGKSDEFFVGGYRGFLGKIQITAEGANLTKITAPLTLDTLVIRALSTDEAIIGTAKGEIYRFANNELKLIKSLSEFNDPIMDMAVKGDEVWAVGPRGLIAHSLDKGKTWNLLEIEYVKKQVTLESTEAITWNLGASNIDLDSLVFNPTVNGKKAVDDEDYYFNADGGNIEVVNLLDESSDLTVSFNYRPGPQYQAGDVSLNTVSFFGDSVLIAGEFGTVIVLGGDGQWTSIYEDVRRDDSNMPYWIESSVVGDKVALVGAGGVAVMTSDAGANWSQYDMDSDNGLFDVSIINDNNILAAGAVGTAAINQDNKWTIADRSKLGLIAWLKTIVKLDGNDFIIAGGRGTLVLYKNNKWTKLVVREVTE
jgi:photosystem II stability/assembly factor-like uncharacterized protein